MTPGLSLSMKMSSSMSPGPKVQFLLVGTETSFTLSMTGAIKYNDYTYNKHKVHRNTENLQILDVF